MCSFDYFGKCNDRRIYYSDNLLFWKFEVGFFGSISFAYHSNEGLNYNVDDLQLVTPVESNVIHPNLTIRFIRN